MAQNISDTLAGNLESLLKKRNLTFDQLSQLSGVSKGMLVQIEQGKTNPSIQTLWKIANSLNVTVAKLLEIKTPSSDIQIISDEDAAELWQGPVGSSAKLLMGLDDKNLIEFWRWKLLPGHKHVSKAHISNAMEFVYVQKGDLKLVIDGNRKNIKAGEICLFSADKPHSYENMSDQQLTFVMIVVEPSND